MSDDVPRVQPLTVALALLAALAYEVGRSDGGDRLSMAAVFLGIAAGVVVLHLLAMRLERRVAWTHRFGNPIAVGVGFGTLAVAYVQRMFFGTGLPFEMMLVAALRNIVLVTAVLSYDPAFRRPTAIFGTFTIVFATALTTDPLFYGLVVLYAVLGVWWLMGTYWSTLRVNLLPSTEQHRPTRWMLSLPILVAGCLLAMPLVARDTTRALMGIAPSSGGTGSYDPFARDGVGNGDMLVAGEKDIQTFAPIDNAPFMQSHDPSLYDCFDENYAEPFIPKKTERAISLPQEALAELRERELSKTEKANRQFSIMRKHPNAKRRGDVDSIRNDALLFVAGRVPVHLRLAVYDIFDGTSWSMEPMLPHPPQLQIADVNERPWLRVKRHLDRDEFRDDVTHAVKFVNLKTNRLPTPPNTLGIHIDQVDREDMFRWVQPSIVRMSRDRIPSLLVVHTHAGLVDPDVLAERIPAPPHAHRHHGRLPTDEATKRIGELAEEWVEGVPRGWPQINRIVERLRTDYVLDHAARPPRDADSPVAHFLFESRRGPDYMFATSAVLMVRSLGYSCRYVSGFYADPDDYDLRSRHTPIRSDDVHVWAEVNIGADTWITIEPTPGYEVLGPEPTVWDRTVEMAVVVAAWVTRNAVALTVTCVLVTLVWWFRASLADSGRRLAWSWWPSRDERSSALRAWRIVEQRLATLEQPRPPGVTPRAWVAGRLPWLEPDTRDRLLELVRLAEWATYSIDSSRPERVDASVCDQVVQQDTFRSLRRMARRASSDGDARSAVAQPRTLQGSLS